MPKCDFNKVALLKSHFGMGVLLQTCCIFSEHSFLGTPLGGCFWNHYVLRVYIYIFFIWSASEKELDDFLERVNNLHPNLKFTHERSREEINFHDVTVRVNHGEFITNLYCEPTDGHQYLHFESCHPSHTKSSIIFSQALRMRRICSKKSVLLPILESLRTGSRKGAIWRIWLTRKQKGHLKLLH